MARKYAAVMLLDRKGLVMLQQKTLDAPHHAGMWGMFGGGIEEGETALSAAVREIKEELEIELAPETLLHVGDFAFPDAEITVFRAEVPVDSALPLHEGRGMGYFTKEEIEHLRVSPNDRQILLELFNARPVE